MANISNNRGLGIDDLNTLSFSLSSSTSIAATPPDRLVIPRGDKKYYQTRNTGWFNSRSQIRQVYQKILRKFQARKIRYIQPTIEAQHDGSRANSIAA
jgi:hypothetical protein